MSKWNRIFSSVLFFASLVIPSLPPPAYAQGEQKKVPEGQAEHCLKERTAHCLLKVFQDNRGETRDLVFYTIQLGDTELAKELWPASKDYNRGTLLFLAGEYEAGKAQMLDRSAFVNGSAINALIKRGDLDEALNIADQTRELFDPYVPLVDSTSDFQPSAPATAYAWDVSGLLKKFLERGDLKKAQQALMLIRKTYTDKRCQSKERRCDTDVLSPYGYAVKTLTSALLKKNDKESARIVLTDYIGDVKKMKGSMGRTASPLRPDYAFLADGLVKTGAKDEAIALAKFAEEEVPYRYKGLAEIRAGYDYSAIVLGEASEYSAAFSRIGKLKSYSVQMPDSWTLPVNALNVQIISLLEISRRAALRQDLKDALAALKELEPLLGKRDDIGSNVSDYVAISSVFFDLGEISQSKAALDKAVAYLSPKGWLPPNYKDSNDDARLYPAIGLMYAKHGDWKALKNWASHSELHAAVGQVLDYFARAEKWQDFDEALRIYKNVGKEEKLYVGNELLRLLVVKQQYARYFDIIGEPASRDHDNGRRAQIIAAAFSGQDIPEDILFKAWRGYVDLCNRYNNPRLDILEQCYVNLWKEIWYFRQAQDRGEFE